MPGFISFRVILVIFIGIAIVYLISSGAYQPQTLIELREYIQTKGWIGPIVFIISFSILQPIGMGAHGFIIASSLIWPIHLAFTYSLIGATLAAVFAFWFARYVGYQWVQNRLPDKLRVYEKRLVENQFRSMLIMRLLFFTFAPMQLMFGVTRVQFPTFLITTVLGISPLILIEVWLGGTLFEWLMNLNA